MKKKCAAAVIFAALAVCLSGCSHGGATGNLRELDRIELVQTIGIDREGDMISVTAATGSLSETGPTILTGNAATISRALSNIHSYSPKKYLFFGHTNYILLGEGITDDISPCRDYVERGISMRMDTPTFAVRGTSAKEFMRKARMGDASVTEMLESLLNESDVGAANHMFSMKDIAWSLASDGCALVFAVKLTEDSDYVSGEGANILPDGYAVFSGNRAVGYIEMDDCEGVNLILNKFGSTVVEIPDGAGNVAALKLTGSDCRVKPVFSGDLLAGIGLEFRMTANIEETDGRLDLDDGEVINRLAASFCRVQRGKILRAIADAKELDVDFLQIGRRAYIASSRRFAPFFEKWDSIFAGTDVSVEVTAVIERTYDVIDSGGAE